MNDIREAAANYAKRNSWFRVQSPKPFSARYAGAFYCAATYDELVAKIAEAMGGAA